MSDQKQIHSLEMPARLDVEALAKRLLTGKTSVLEGMLRELAATALEAARPRGIYQIAPSRVIGNNRVDIGGVVFTSKVLSKLLEGRDTVIPFIVTVGKELDELPIARGDMMKNFYLDTIKTMLLVNAVNYLKDYVQEKHDMPQAALMNPGEIEDWYISEQRPLFSLFGEAAERIGVTLTGGGVMKPIKSRSGIIFPNESGFETCQLCTQFKCPGRRVKYEPELVKYYLGK